MTYHRTRFTITLSLNEYPISLMDRKEISELQAIVRLNLGFESVLNHNLIGYIQPEQFSGCSPEGIWPDACHSSLSGLVQDTFDLTCNTAPPDTYYSRNLHNVDNQPYKGLSSPINNNSAFYDYYNKDCLSTCHGQAEIYDIHGNIITTVNSPEILSMKLRKIHSHIFILRCHDCAINIIDND